jgi:phytoene desaturase
MNYADLSLGTWYPMGGMHKIVEGMVNVAVEQGVDIRFDHEVTGFTYNPDGSIQAVLTNKGDIQADIVVGGADYHHLDQKILSEGKRNYTAKYWDSRKMAPSSLLFYLGVNRKLDGLKHHNLFFDEDFGLHATEIYDDPKWPSKPLFYASCPSKTDPSVAPEGQENLFLLVPSAPDLKDSEEVREKYYDLIMDRLESRIGIPVREHIVYKRSYALDDFKKDYNSFKGNAYGLANTLFQTAILKPSLKSKKVKNLYFTGQLTTPGPGVPPSLISGEVVSKEIAKDLNISIQ